MKRLLSLVLFASAMLFLPAIAKRFTCGFHLKAICLDFPYHSEWEVEPSAEVNSILKQPFRFFGKGAQCYVFESEDKTDVVKLFRYNRSFTEAKIVRLFNACKIAYDALRDETGLVYIHLNPTQIGLPFLHCKDAVCRSYTIPLDRIRFAIQKRANSFCESLEIARRSPIKMQQRLDQFIDLLQARVAKGIVNTDSTLMDNFGFLEEQAVEFDFGNYCISSRFDRRSEINRYASQLRSWLSEHAPEWVSYFDRQMERLLQ